MLQKNDHNHSTLQDNQDQAVELCSSNSLTGDLKFKISISSPRIELAKVLHIEPNEDCRFLVSVLLQLERYFVTSACTAEEARDILRDKSFDAYILDNSPFDQSGIELCRYICGVDANAVVIFYSGAAYAFNIEQGLKAGAKAYLTKPCGIEILTDTVTRLISIKELTNTSTLEPVRGE